MLISVLKKLKVLMTQLCNRRRKGALLDDDHNEPPEYSDSKSKFEKQIIKEKKRKSKHSAKNKKSITSKRQQDQVKKLHSSQDSDDSSSIQQQTSNASKKDTKSQPNLIIIEDENEFQIVCEQENSRQQQSQQQNEQQEQSLPQIQVNRSEISISQQQTSNKNLQEAIMKYYNKQEILFFNQPQPVETIISGENGEYKANPIKAQEIMSIFQQMKVKYISKVRGDGNCFFRSLVQNYLLSCIGQACQNGQDNQKINQIFQEMLQIPLILPTNQSESLGSSFSYEEITSLVHDTLNTLKFNLINTNAVIQSLMVCLNDPCVDFSLQIWIKSWLVEGMKDVMQNEISPLCFITSSEEILQQIQPQNIEGGDDIIFQLVACIFNSELSIIRVQRNGGFDSIQLHPLEPKLPFSNLQLNNSLVLWYKTGHYYIAYTERQVQLLGNMD